MIFQHKARYVSIDILKGIAIIMIILVHYNQNYLEGVRLLSFFQMGCPLFFVASGFGIAYLINGKYINDNKTYDVKNFYLSRLKAIVPGWYVAIIFFQIINIICNNVFKIDQGFYISNNISDIICNLLLINGFVPSANNSVLVGGWYIGALIILYLISPLIVFEFNKYIEKRKILFAEICIISIALFGIYIYLSNIIMGSDGLGYFCFLNHLPSYCLGMLLYYEFSSNRLSNKRILVYSLLGIASMIFAIVVFFINITGHSIISLWLTSISAYFILYSALSYEVSKGINTKIKALSLFGRNSYYIYLFHSLAAYTFSSLIINMLAKHGLVINNTYFIVIALFVILISYFIGVLFKLLVYYIDLAFKSFILSNKK